MRYATQFSLATILACVCLGVAYSEELKPDESATTNGGRGKTDMSPEKQALLRRGQEYDRQSAGLYFASKYDEAIEPMKKSLDLYIRSLGPDHYYVGDNYAHLGQMYAALHDRKNAEAAYRKAMAVFEKHSSCQASDAARGLLRILNETGRQKEAKELEKRYQSLHCPLN